MELQEILNNLKKSRTEIADYADLDNRIWQLQFNAANYNRRRLFSGLGLGASALMLLLLTTGSGPIAPIGVIIYTVPLTYLFFRFGIGGTLDYFKRKTLKQQIIPDIQNLSGSLNSIAERLDGFTVLPEQYRTLHAVDTLGGYLINKRADSLKEAINLYEDELFKYKQLHNQNIQIQQNSRIMNQNKEMIKAQKITNKRLLWM